MAFSQSLTLTQLGGAHAINASVAGDQSRPHVVATDGGRSAIFYSDGARLLGRIVDATGAATGSEQIVATGADFTGSIATAAATLGNGDIVVAWATAGNPGNILFRRYDHNLTPLGAAADAETGFISTTAPAIAALRNGGFVIAWEKVFSGTDHDIAFRRFSASGVSTDDGSGIALDTGASLDTGVSLAVTGEGNIAFAFSRSTGVSASMFHALYNGATGASIVGPAVFQANGAQNTEGDVVATPNGGYIVSFAGSGDVTSARFTSTGALIGKTLMGQSPFLDLNPTAAVSADGFVAVLDTEDVAADIRASFLGPDGARLGVDQLAHGGAGAQFFNSVRWLDRSHIIVADTSNDATNGGDGAGYGVATVIDEVHRVATGDGANDAMVFTSDGIIDFLNGGGGDDTIISGAGADNLRGGAGNDGLYGGAGDDLLFGDDGLDTLYGGDGNDYVEADAGASSVLGGEAGNDTLYGGAGNDYAVGGDGDDVIVGLGGQDSLYGGAGNDYIVAGDGPGSVVDGGPGANTLWGGNGADYMVGGEGPDLIVGGAGFDYLFGNAGNDTLYGGQGTDFIYSNAGNDFIWTDDVGFAQSGDFIYVGGGTGVDTVADFLPGDAFNHDTIVVSPASGLSSFAQAKAAMVQVGVYTVLTMSGGDQLYLFNVQPFQLTASDFLFF